MKAILTFLACAFASTLFSQSNIQQSLSVNGSGNAADASAQLDVSANDKGMLVPRMSSALRGAIASPVNGLLVYDTDTNSFWHFNGTAWVNLTTARTLQDADGNTKVQVEESPNENIIRFDVNGNEAMVIDPTGRVGIGTGAPAQKLDILGGNPDEGAIMQMSNSDRTKFFRLFSGRENDANPFLNWQDGTDFRFATSNNDFSGFAERMRLTANGSLGIGTATPDASALLDVQSATKGVLVPRMDSLARAAIASPATGLLVYDTDTNAFWYFNGTAWAKISPQTVLADADGDTKIQVEESPNEDIIRFDLGGDEKMVLRKNANGASRLELPDLAHNTIIGEEAGVNNTPVPGSLGEENLFIGYRAGNANTTGRQNSFTGSLAGRNNTGGNGNTASGWSALRNNTTGDDNTASGLQALYSNTFGDNNTASGVAALYSNKANSRSTAIGYSAMYYADNRTDGRETFNTAVGFEALLGSATPAANTGRFNTAIGDQALFSNTSGSYNTANGVQALYSNKANGRSTAIGYNAMYHADDRTSGRETFNTAIGFEALLGSPTAANNTGQYNTAIGDRALFSNTSGIHNTANGVNALFSNTAGDYNTANGVSALFSNKANRRSTAIGYNAMFYADDRTSLGRETFNTAIGYEALKGSAAPAENTGRFNTAIGDRALFSNTSGFSNVALGINALYLNTDRSNLVAVGDSALYNNGQGASGAFQAKFNTAVGSKALLSNTTGYENTAVGGQALLSNTAGSDNTAVGRQALLSNTAGAYNTCVGALSGDLSNSSYNSFFGFDSGGATTIGSQNTFIGSNAGNTNTTGTDNTTLGDDADLSSGDFTNSVAIGNTATVNASNKARIGNTSVTVIEGQVDWTFPSDARFKFNIHDDGVPGLTFINQLRPVTYQFDTRKFDEHLMQNMPDSIQRRRMEGQDYSKSSATVQTGFLAQEVEQVCKDLNFTFSGLHVPTSEVDNYGLAYGSFVPLLVKAVQEQQVEIETLKAENAALKSQLDKITAALAGAGIAVEK